MASCPIPGPDWNDLVTHLGQESAYAVFVKAGDRVPLIRTLLNGKPSKTFAVAQDLWGTKAAVGAMGYVASSGFEFVLDENGEPQWVSWDGWVDGQRNVNDKGPEHGLLMADGNIASFDANGVLRGDVVHRVVNAQDLLGSYNEMASPERRLSSLPEADPIDVNNLNALKARLEEAFGIPIRYDSTIPGAGQVRVENGRPIVLIHPERIKAEYVAHEYAHILIDGIGGPLVQAGLIQIRNSPIWDEVRRLYPNLSEERVTKEALATAIGRKVEEIFVQEKDKSIWRRWLDLFVGRVAQVFGIKRDSVLDLSRQLLRKNTNISRVWDPTYVENALGVDAIAAKIRRIRQTDPATKERRDDAKRKIDLYVKGLISERSKLERHTAANSPELLELEHQIKILTSDSAYTSRADQYAVIIRHAAKDMQGLATKVKDMVGKGEADAASVLNLDRIAKSYSILEDIYRDMAESKALADLLTTELKVDAVDVVDKLNIKRKELESLFSELGKELMVQRFLPYERRVKIQFQEEYRKNYRTRVAAGLDVKGQTEHEYVMELMETNAEMILTKQIESLSRSLDYIQDDTGAVESWLYAFKNSRHAFAPLVGEMIDKADYIAALEFNEFQRTNAELKAKLIAHEKSSDPNVLFGDMLQKNKEGAYTGRLVSEYRPEFYYELAKIKKKFMKSPELTSAEWATFQKEDLDFAEDTREKVEEATKGMDQWTKRKWILNNVLNFAKPSAKWKNPEYLKFDPTSSSFLGKDHPKVLFYNFMMENRRNSDKWMQPNKKFNDKIAFLSKSVADQINERGMSASSGWQMMQGMVHLRPDDLDHKILEDTPVDRTGKRIYRVPVHFHPGSPKIDEAMNTDLRSIDLSALMNAEMHSKFNYRAKSKIAPELEILKEMLGQADVEVKQGLVTKMYRTVMTIGKTEKVVPMAVTRKGVDSKLYASMSSMLEDRLYGLTTSEDDPIQINPKIVTTVLGYSGALLLSLNVSAALANVSIGSITTFMESGTRGVFSKAAYGRAVKNYWKDIGGVLRDVTEQSYGSKTNFLSLEYDALNRGIHTHRDARQGTATLAMDGALGYLNTSAEHFMQSTVMYAVLDDTQVFDAEGKPMGSLLSMYEVKDGALVMTQTPHSIRIGKSNDMLWNDDAKFLVKQRINKINEDLHGAYSQQNKAQAERYVLGKFAMMFRKWIMPSLIRRWGGMNVVKSALFDFNDDPNKRRKINLDLETTRWDQQLGIETEGFVITTWKFLGALTKDLQNTKKSLAMLRGATYTSPADLADAPDIDVSGIGFGDAYAHAKSQLSEMQLNNLSRMLKEVLAISSLYVLGMALRGLAEGGDEEDENMVYFLAYQTNRLYSELSFYYNPAEFGRILSSPAASVSVFDRVIKLVSQILTFNVMEEYETGTRAGDMIIYYRIRDLVPGWKPIEDLTDMKTKYNFFY